VLACPTEGNFSGLFGFSGATLIIGPPDAVERTSGAWVSGAYYETLGVLPVAASACPMTIGQAQRRWPSSPTSIGTENSSRDPRAIGQRILIEGVPVTIAGVSPAGFTGANVGSVRISQCRSLRLADPAK